MLNRKLLFLVLVVLLLVPVPVLAKKPNPIEGTWDGLDIDPVAGTISFDFHSTNFNGTTTQPLVGHGRATKGVFVGTVGGQAVVCEYNLSPFSLPSNADHAAKTMQMVAHFVMQECEGEVKLKVLGVAYLDDPVNYTGTFDGTYHYGP